MPLGQAVGHRSSGWQAPQAIAHRAPGRRRLTIRLPRWAFKVAARTAARELAMLGYVPLVRWVDYDRFGVTVALGGVSLGAVLIVRGARVRCEGLMCAPRHRRAIMRAVRGALETERAKAVGLLEGGERLALPGPRRRQGEPSAPPDSQNQA